LSPLKRLVALTYRIPIEYVERAGLALSEIDLVEVNEAFACQNLAVEKELGLDRKK
jgi:acetyl-CoA acetyltransferase